MNGIQQFANIDIDLVMRGYIDAPLDSHIAPGFAHGNVHICSDRMAVYQYRGALEALVREENG
jgi:hypothetical protein